MHTAPLDSINFSKARTLSHVEELDILMQFERDARAVYYATNRMRINKLIMGIGKHSKGKTSPRPPTHHFFDDCDVQYKISKHEAFQHYRESIDDLNPSMPGVRSR